MWDDDERGERVRVDLDLEPIEAVVIEQRGGTIFSNTESENPEPIVSKYSKTGGVCDVLSPSPYLLSPR